MTGTIISRCESQGLRMTEQRRVIAQVLEDADDHPDVEALYARASAVDPNISIATVYRTVKLFEEAGILERHEFGDGRVADEGLCDVDPERLVGEITHLGDLCPCGLRRDGPEQCLFWKWFRGDTH